MIPFVGILLSIAIFPLLAHEFWEKHLGKISIFWALCFLIPYAAQYGLADTGHHLAHTALHEYIPFIILLFTLYVITGGIHLTGRFAGTPLFNVGYLAIASVFASLIGTTGAAMLFVRPLIRANSWRHHRTHTMVFFIIMVANIGGSLTPIGDPPLLLGFLKGVGFMWTVIHMAAPFLVAIGMLLVIFYALDRHFFKADKDNTNVHAEDEPRLRIDGKKNITYLLGVILAVFISGQVPGGIAVSLARDATLLLIAYLSYTRTGHYIREMNHFTWEPIEEVALLFIGIFVTIIPAIMILKAGHDGELKSLVEMTFNPDGTPNNTMFFWLTGILSSFLDNAPTYLVFFNLAGGDPVTLMGPLASTLLAISVGSVFMGANSYIGNAPNLMVKAIAQGRGIRMPSFFGYIGWTALINIPVLIVVSLLFF